MIDIIRKEIKFIDKCSKIESINKGFSYAQVFKVHKDDKNYILKIYKNNETDRKSITDKYIETNQPIPKVIEYGKTETFGYYIIMDYIENGTLEEQYINLSDEDVFNKAKFLGEKHKNLIKKYSSDNKDFFIEFKNAEFQKYNRTVELIEKHKDELPNIDVVKIKEDMERLIEYFKEDIPLYMHVDLKSDNIVMSNELLMIDYEDGFLSYLPISLRYELHHIMNNDEKASRSKAFIKGIISGIDEKLLEDKNLNKKLAYAYLKSAFVNIIGYYLKNNKIEEAKERIYKINNVYCRSEKIENLL